MAATVAAKGGRRALTNAEWERRFNALVSREARELEADAARCERVQVPEELMERARVARMGSSLGRVFSVATARPARQGAE